MPGYGRDAGIRRRAIGSRIAPASVGETAEAESARLLATSIAKLRRQRDLAFYMGYCPHRRKGHVSCGTRDGRTLSRRRRLDRHACSS
jgi:hypothetical protein